MDLLQFLLVNQMDVPSNPTQVPDSSFGRCHAQRPANIPGVVKDLPTMSFGMNEFNPSKGCVEDTGTSRGHHGYAG